MKTCTVRNSEVNEVMATLNQDAQPGAANIAVYENKDFQFIMKASGAMFSYDAARGTYKTFTDRQAFARAIVRFVKRGY